MYIHQFDFKRWFSLKVMAKLQRSRPFDSEVVNLVVTYLSTNSRNLDKIYLPFLFEKYSVVGRDNYLERDLIHAAMPKFYGFIAKIL